MQGVVLDSETLSLEDLDLTALEASGPAWQFHDYTMPGDVAERIENAEVVVTNKVVLDAALIEWAPALKLICISATGTNNVDLDAARRRGIPVCNVTGYATASVVQHTLALMLSLATRWHQYHADVRDGAWSRSRQFCLLDHPVVELAGKTLGIVGYGELGRGVARMAEALGMRVLVSESLRPDAAPDNERTSLPTLMAQSDVVSLHCPLTPQTQRLINSETLAWMKPGAFLINTARGGLVDEQALLAALKQGHLGGAAVDVLSQEPPPADNPLLGYQGENLLITPHSAWVSRECRQRLLDGVAGNIRAWRAGGLQCCVNGLQAS
jgi:glycerate dehydrogenase